MKKTLADPLHTAAIIARFNTLTPNTGNHWGSMNVAEMLLHCTLANRFVLEDKSPYRKPSITERLKKFACLHIITNLPKNRIGPARLQTKDKIDIGAFELQKAAAIKSVADLAAHKGPITSLHAALGYLTPAEWGIIAWMHMDHHLRQFGV